MYIDMCVYIYIYICMCVCMCVLLNHFAVLSKLTQHRKLTIVHKKWLINMFSLAK